MLDAHLAAGQRDMPIGPIGLGGQIFAAPLPQADKLQMRLRMIGKFIGSGQQTDRLHFGRVIIDRTKHFKAELRHGLPNLSHQNRAAPHRPCREKLAAPAP